MALIIPLWDREREGEEEGEKEEKDTERINQRKGEGGNRRRNVNTVLLIALRPWRE